MRLFPKSKIGKIIFWILLVLFVLILVAAIAGGIWLKGLIITGGGGDKPLPVEETTGVTSGSAMVVGTTSANTQEIGIEILQKGGNAIDAALATSMAQITMAAGSWVSFAGLLNMVYYDAETGEVYNLNANFDTVASEDDPMSTPGINYMAMSQGGTGTGHLNGRTVMVPGFVAGVEAAHGRFGALPWADLFEPSIRLAEDGIEVNEGLDGQFKFRKTILSTFPETEAVFFKEDGTLYEKGDLFKQTALAETLRHVAEEGAGYMYSGPWAEAFVEAVQGIGGKITMDDMTTYEAMWTEPVRATYGDFEIYAHGLPSYGGVNLLEALNLLEAGDVAGMGHYATEPEALFWMSHVVRAGQVSRAVEGDMDEILATYRQRLTDDHARTLWQRMQDNGGFEVGLVDHSPKHSDGVVVVDAEGNIVALTHSINTLTYGETGLVIGGVSVPDALTNQKDVAAWVPPGDRLPDPTCPAVIFKDGRPFGGFSSIGAGLHERMVNVLFSVLWFDMTPQEALNQPSMGLSLAFPGWFGALLGEHQTIGTGTIDADVIEATEEMGLDLAYTPVMPGYLVGITIDSETGELHGGTIERFGGRAVGF